MARRPPTGPSMRKNSASSRPVPYPPAMTTDWKTNPGSRMRRRNGQSDSWPLAGSGDSPLLRHVGPWPARASRGISGPIKRRGSEVNFLKETFAFRRLTGVTSPQLFRSVFGPPPRARLFHAFSSVLFFRIYSSLRLLGLGGPLQAQQGTLTGRVTDRDGIPIDGAQIQVLGGAESLGSHFQRPGSLQHPTSRRDLFSRWCSYLGYRTERFDGIAVMSGQTTSFDIRLSPTALGLRRTRGYRLPGHAREAGGCPGHRAPGGA